MQMDRRLEVILVPKAIEHPLDHLNLSVEPRRVIRPCLLLKGIRRNETRM